MASAIVAPARLLIAEGFAGCVCDYSGRSYERRFTIPDSAA
jgi:hypothetical protein